MLRSCGVCPTATNQLCELVPCLYRNCRHADELPLEIERLWRTLAHNRRNIIPMLDFLASLGTHMSYQVSISNKQHTPAPWVASSA